MTGKIILCLVLLPLLMALQRFSVAYGYQGEARPKCIGDALRLALFIYLIEGAGVAIWAL